MQKPAAISELLKRNKGLTYCDDGEGDGNGAGISDSSSDSGSSTSTSADNTAALNVLYGGANEPCAPNRGTLGSVRQERGGNRFVLVKPPNL